MSVEIQVDVYGIPELQDKLARLDQSMRGRVDGALDFEVQAMQTRAQSLAPKRTGRLANSIIAQRMQEWTFRLIALAPYAKYVEYGTKRMLGRFFLARALELGMLGLVQHVNRAIDDAIGEASV